MRISDWSSDVCSSDLQCAFTPARRDIAVGARGEGLFEIDEHHHSELRRHPGQRDKADAARDRLIISQQIEQPQPAGQREGQGAHDEQRSEEHTSELQSLMRTSYAVFCLKKKTQKT